MPIEAIAARTKEHFVSLFLKKSTFSCFWVNFAIK